MPSYWSKLDPTQRPMHVFDDGGLTEPNAQPECIVPGCTWPSWDHPFEEELETLREAEQDG